MIWVIYAIIAFVAFYLFMKRSQQGWRLTSLDIYGGFLAGIFWPAYFINLLVLRAFNGDWR